MSARDNIRTLRIPRKHLCPMCGKEYTLTDEERYNLAECMIANYAGIWAINNCKHCGVPEQVYPTAINGVPCTAAECDLLSKEMAKYDEQEARAI